MTMPTIEELETVKAAVERDKMWPPIFRQWIRYALDQAITARTVDVEGLKVAACEYWGSFTYPAAPTLPCLFDHLAERGLLRGLVLGNGEGGE